MGGQENVKQLEGCSVSNGFPWVFSVAGALFAVPVMLKTYSFAPLVILGTTGLVADIEVQLMMKLREAMKPLEAQMKLLEGQMKTLEGQMKLLEAQMKTLGGQMKLLEAQMKLLKSQNSR